MYMALYGSTIVVMTKVVKMYIFSFVEKEFQSVNGSRESVNWELSKKYHS